jgi:hypothetical protein
MNCSTCNLVLEEAQPKTTLLCGHIIHTQCFITDILRSDIERISCGECTIRVVTPEIYAIVYPNVPDSCKNLEETSEDFRNDVKILSTKNTDYNKSVSKFKRKIAPIVSEYKTHVSPQISILKSYIKNKMKIIKETQEYADVMKKQTALNRHHKKTYTKYNLAPYEFRNYIRRSHRIDLKGWYQSVSNKLARKFRIRI